MIFTAQQARALADSKTESERKEYANQQYDQIMFLVEAKATQGFVRIDLAIVPNKYTIELLQSNGFVYIEKFVPGAKEVISITWL